MTRTPDLEIIDYLIEREYDKDLDEALYELKRAKVAYCRIKPKLCEDAEWYKKIADNVLDFHRKREAAYPPIPHEMVRRSIHGRFMKPMPLPKSEYEKDRKHSRGKTTGQGAKPHRTRRSRVHRRRYP